MRRSTYSAIIGLAFGATAAEAHHSIAGVYDNDRETTLAGVITEFHFVQPHPYLLLGVESRGDRRQFWRLEMDNRFELVRIGITKETFRPGDEVVVSGNPTRAETKQLYLRRLDRPADGACYEQVGWHPALC